MNALSLRFREQLDETTGNELEQLVASLNSILGSLTAAASFIRYGCASYGNTNQAIATGTFTAVTFDSDEWDVGNCHSTTANPTRFTVPHGGAGVYLLSAVISFMTSAVGQRIIKVTKNGQEIRGNGYIMTSTGGVYVTGMSFSLVTPLNDGDYLEVIAYQDTGGNLNIGWTGPTGSYIQNRANFIRLSD